MVEGKCRYMIILGNKYQITKDEKKELLNKVNCIHQIDILDDEEIINEIKIVLEQEDVEFIVLNIENTLSLKISAYLEELDYIGIKIMLFSNFTLIFLNREFIIFNEKNFDLYQHIHNNNFQDISKRVFDFVFSFSILIFTFPLFILITIFIKIKSPNGSIFFIQERLGKNRKFFRVYKFRTMIVNAEKELEKLLESDEKMREEYIKFRKLKYDPRIIKGIGNFLRKTSLDEFPQFFNVLLGDMSIVGPRPYLKDEFYNHDDTFLDILLSIKPGITGLWQVGNRNNSTFNDRVKDDLIYIENQSFIGDLIIIFKTIKVMIFRKGA